MAKKIAKYRLPDKAEDLNTLAKSVFDYASPHMDGDSTVVTESPSSATKTAADPVEQWTDIAPASWAAFKAAYAVWVPAYAACKVPHLPRDTEAKNLAEAALREALTDLLDRGLLLPPRTAEDAVAMGFHLLDHTRTVVTVVNDAVDIDSVTNAPIPGSHTHIVRYHIEGHQHRAKAPYHMAIFQVYIQGPDDPAPILNSERGWSKDYISLNEPFELRHEPSDVGKLAHYRAHWETDGSVKGPWSMASAEIP